MMFSCDLHLKAPAAALLFFGRHIRLASWTDVRFDRRRGLWNVFCLRSKHTNGGPGALESTGVHRDGSAGGSDEVELRHVASRFDAQSI